MLTTSQEQALARIAAAAVACEHQTGCPAELSTAQCILESAWLTRCPGCNCFGIKASDTHATYQVTKEYLEGKWATMRLAFEAYDSLTDCFVAHARLIQRGRYSDAWRQWEQNHNLDELIRSIGSIYATDPHYTEEVLTLAHGPHVTAAICDARQQLQAA